MSKVDMLCLCGPIECLLLHVKCSMHFWFHYISGIVKLLIGVHLLDILK